MAMASSSSFASLPPSSMDAALSNLLPATVNNNSFLSVPPITSLRSSLHLKKTPSFSSSSSRHPPPPQLVAFAARKPSSSSSSHHPQEDEGAAASPPPLDNQNNNGFQLASPDSLSLPQIDSVDKQAREDHIDRKSDVITPVMIPHANMAGGGTRAGLFRTPISGGVQSATSAHGLPRPALAVRNLMEQARFAHLCTVMSRMHHRREGYPFGSLVDFAPDSMGHPIFSFSPLAIHTRNLLADPRCTLVVQIPGWSGLSNARVTIFGDVYPLAEDQQEWAHKQYIAKHQQGPSQQWGNFYYFRMQTISDIYFIGGFGTVAWVDVKEYETLQPDKIAVDGGEQNLKELNVTFSKPLKELLSQEIEVDDAALISIDSKGIDIRVRQGAQFNIQRISFEGGQSVETLEEAKEALWKLIKKGCVYNLQK
ncbi:OLC1v1015317C4 [Oldenlandia corymbosa var. corymbosa]|uniref:OLC1v1015317C4 n=1 Tax=Oldenlandia corymbosa var. corymbosa TaxID=529605 RepID=A0AAV1E2Z2_OLDCO|nr:OLC1v1015317C4 [Oldenlandia corymbosa var. corymbosa]